jgi:2-polyprenyl-3-methyl-5-hydroxy-6-metoxy-1,4-benzoquinol methylase
MKINDKKELYKDYISTHFGAIHGDKHDFKIQDRYYRKNYLKHLPPDKKIQILDLGCGMGQFLFFLQNAGYKNVKGIDISRENIEFCKEKNFNVEPGDVFVFLENTKDMYDVIVMNDIIEHLEKQEILRIMNLISGVLRPGGRLIVKAPNAANPVMASSSRYSDFTHELLFTEESLSQVLRITGFKHIILCPQDLYVMYYNPLNYIAKLCNFLLNAVFRLLFRFYGRKTTKIFTKNLIAVAIKE